MWIARAKWEDCHPKSAGSSVHGYNTLRLLASVQSCDDAVSLSFKTSPVQLGVQLDLQEPMGGFLDFQ